MWTVMALVAALAAQADLAAQPALPEWMAGCWEQDRDGRWTEECWTAPRGGIMLGSSRTGIGTRADNWETMQIELETGTDDPPEVRLAFWASPRGTNRTMFTWAPSTESGVTFFNAQNDYPQKIRYWRVGEELHAEISMSDGSKPMRWRYRRPARR